MNIPPPKASHFTVDRYGKDDVKITVHWMDCAEPIEFYIDQGAVDDLHEAVRVLVAKGRNR